MGWVPPPPPLSQKEFDRRWDAGARTIEQLDPALAQWAKDRRTDQKFAVATILFALPVLFWMIIRAMF